jgi:hypothetical protein
VNRQIEVENLQEESFVSQRLICDHIDAVGGIKNVVLAKQLLLFAASARQRYTSHLEDKKQSK